VRWSHDEEAGEADEEGGDEARNNPLHGAGRSPSWWRDEDREKEMTSTQTQASDRTHPPYEIEILAPGTYQGTRIDTEALDQLAENFAKLKGTHDVPVARM